MSIKEDLQKDLKQAILDKNKVKKTAIRYLLAEIKNREIDNKKLWNEITSPYIKSEMLKALEKLADTKGRGWVKTLKKRLS